MQISGRTPENGEGVGVLRLLTEGALAQSLPRDEAPFSSSVALHAVAGGPARRMTHGAERTADDDDDDG